MPSITRDSGRPPGSQTPCTRGHQRTEAMTRKAPPATFSPWAVSRGTTAGLENGRRPRGPTSVDRRKSHAGSFLSVHHRGDRAGSRLELPCGWRSTGWAGSTARPDVYRPTGGASRATSEHTPGCNSCRIPAEEEQEGHLHGEQPAQLPVSCTEKGRAGLACGGLSASAGLAWRREGWRER